MYSHKYRVTEHEAGNAYSHVHHARLVELLELGRNEWFRSLGLPDYSGFLSHGCLLVISKLDVQYLREVRSGDIIITCEDPKIIERRLVVTQRILNERNKPAVVAEVTQAVISVGTKRAADIPQFLRERLCLI